MNKGILKKAIVSAISFLLVCIVLSMTVSAQVPKKLNYQGYLTDTSGIPVNGTVTITLAIYDVATGGTPLWTETQDVNVLAGKFSVHLGETTPINLGIAKPYYLGVKVGADPELPREELTSSMYALFANTIDGITVKNGNVGMGTIEPLPWGRLTLNSPWADWMFLRQERSTQGGGGYHIHNPWKDTDDASRNSLVIAYQPAGEDVRWGQGISFHGPTGNVSIASNLGIGTTNPTTKLDVNGDIRVGTSSKYLLLRSSGWGLDIDAFDRPLHINNASGQPTYFLGGNVGIGTNSPASKLDVRDTLRISKGATSEEYLLLRSTGWALDIDAYNKPLYINNDSGQPTYLLGGNVGIGTAEPQEKLDVNGTTRTRVLQITGGSDIAEPFEITGTIIEPGMVVAIDPQRPGQLRIPDQEYDRTVAGIISGAGGIKPGLTLQQDSSIANGEYPVAMSGRVYCWADASYGSIEPGDLLTTSATPGHAMKVTDYEKAQGAILGKAMSSLDEGKGLVLVLVTLQ